MSVWSGSAPQFILVLHEPIANQKTSEQLSRLQKYNVANFPRSLTQGNFGVSQLLIECKRVDSPSFNYEHLQQ